MEIFYYTCNKSRARLHFHYLVLITRESELESEARLAAVRTENKSESLREARLAADVYRESDC